jgi:hypothetical protein
MPFSKNEPQLRELELEVPITNEQVLMAELLTKSLVLDDNFDTFSFMFELLEIAEMQGVSLQEAYELLNINSVRLTDKYNGSNCGGLAMVLRKRLAELGIYSTLIPCFGSYMPTPEADEYAGVRTTALYLTSKDGRFALIPGLTIPQIIKLENGNQFEAYGTSYIIQNVFPNRFSLIAVKRNGEIIERVFSVTELLNPDESSQKNLLRCRPKYQISRQQDDGTKNQISYDFFKGNFKVVLDSVSMNQTMNLQDFIKFLTENGSMLEELFQNNHLVAGFTRFIQQRDNIVSNLLIESIKDKLLEP